MVKRSNLTFNLVISKNFSSAFRAIGILKYDKTKSIYVLIVGQWVFKGDCVKDGFYTSLSSLKCFESIDILEIISLDSHLIMWF